MTRFCTGQLSMCECISCFSASQNKRVSYFQSFQNLPAVHKRVWENM